MAKKSRRARRAQKANKPSVKPSITEKPVSQAMEVSETSSRKIVDFTQDYYYVYTDIRTLLIVTGVMVVVIFGLSYVF